jgi:large subunit ribosomal protein L1
MAKTKAELLKEAKDLGIELDSKAKVAEIEEAIKSYAAVTTEVAPDTEEITEDQVEADEEKVEAAKSGKRSAKSLKEAAAKEAKEERKNSKEESAAAPKAHVKPTRSRLERRGKHFRKSAEQLEANKVYTLDESVALAKKTSHVKFDATVELHINLGVDPRQADQNIRDNLLLPAGSGKKVRVAVLADDAAGAKSAGADIAGAEDILSALDKGKMDFDILIATPTLMPRLGKYARVLGPRGLMPNPKSGTVTTDVNRAVAEAKAGRVEYRVDSTGIIHLGVGKVSFTEAQLLENVQAVIASIKANRPSGVKGNYVKSIHMTTTMGPSITVDVNAAA